MPGKLARRHVSNAPEVLTRIASVRHVEIRVRDRGIPPPDGRPWVGTALVEANRSGMRVTWLESGAWYGAEPYGDSKQPPHAADRRANIDGIRFRNELRWAQLGAALLQLERPRQGSTRDPAAAAALDVNLAPVRIALVPDATGAWVSASAHLCGKDLYTARLELRDDDMTLVWIVRGPRKDLLISCRYKA